MAAGQDRRKPISLIVAALLAAVLLYYSLRGIEWRQVARIVAHASAGPARPVDAHGDGDAVPARLSAGAFCSTPRDRSASPPSSGRRRPAYFGNNFLPARAGELVRTVMISSRSGLGNAYVLATALSERVADTIVLVIISAVVLLTLPIPPGWLARAARPLAALGLIGALAIAILPLCGPLLRGALARSPLPAALRAQARRRG